MNHVVGTPNALRQVNLSAVRKVIKESGSATRAEIAAATKIGVTTVRTLLTEMLNNKEIMKAGYDQSIGGRKAVRYTLKKDRFFGAAFCLDGERVRYLIVNICGEIHEEGAFAVKGSIPESICSFLDTVVTNMEIRSIGIGVPGIVNGMGYQRKNAEGVLENHLIGDSISSRYGVPVMLENDLNAITMGFGRCYLSEFPEERCENVNMAYLHFDRDCISAGFLSGGRILRGWNNFVGELGLFPVGEDSTLDELLASPLEADRYASYVAQLIAGICCVLNPQYVAVGGVGFRKDCLSLITEYFNGTLPDQMSAEILYAEDKWHDYLGGMAYLTAEQIFAQILLVKEPR